MKPPWLTGTLNMPLLDHLKDTFSICSGFAARPSGVTVALAGPMRSCCADVRSRSNCSNAQRDLAMPSPTPPKTVTTAVMRIKVNVLATRGLDDRVTAPSSEITGKNAELGRKHIKSLQ